MHQDLSHTKSTRNARSAPSRSRHRRLIAAVATGTLALAACGGSASTDDDADFSNAPTEDTGDAVDDIDGLDEGQEELLDDLLDDVDEIGNGDDIGRGDDAATAPWNGIRLVDGRSQVAVDRIDADAFSGSVDVFSTPIEDPIGNVEFGTRSIDDHVVVDETLWQSGRTSVRAVSLADGTVTSTIEVDEVLPGGEFGDITGDANGVFVLATVPGGGDVVAELDPATGALRSTIDLTDEANPLLTIASTDTHVAAAFRDAPGIPVSLIDRSTGEVMEVGDYSSLHEVHFVRGELWVVLASGNVNEPGTYEKYSVDGTLIGGATLPRTGVLRVLGDRAVVVEQSNRTDPDAPVKPIEVEPVGTPIEDFLPDAMVTLTGYAEIDGFAISSGSCCLRDEGGFPLSTAIVDMATGEVVHTADSLRATAILPAT